MDNLANNVNECVIEFVRGDKTASVTAASSTRLNGRIKKLAEQFPEEVQILSTNEDGSIFAHIPVRFIKVGAPRKVEMTDEQKAELAERFRQTRERLKAKRESEAQAAEFADCMNVPE